MKGGEKCRKSTNKKQMLKESLKPLREKKKERAKGGERKEYKTKTTRVKKEGNFPANIYTPSKYNRKM